MSTISKPAREVAVGRAFLHPDTGVTLRRVGPKNGIGLVGPHVSNDCVFAVDDEGGLYVLRPAQQVEVPFNVPLILQPCDDKYIIIASFERQLSDDMPILETQYRRGNIDADPHKDFPLAAMQQIALELRPGYEQGMGGFFQCHRVIEGHAWDHPKMGWGANNSMEATGPDDDDPTRKRT